MNATNNPYQAPTSRVDQRDRTAAIVPASRGTRFANFLVDRVAIFGMSFAFGFAIALAGHASMLQGMGIGGQYLLGVCIELVYYIPLEMMFGRTLGKLVTGTEVVNEKGERPTAAQVVGRTFARMIPFEPFSFFGDPARGWHDTLSGTYVVKRR